MDRKTNPFRAPWRTGNGLSCSVFDAAGGIVATIYATTLDEQRKRLQVVKVAPLLLDNLKTTSGMLQALLRGEQVEPHAIAYRIDQIEAAIQEAEPV